MEPTISLNYLAILVCVIVQMVVGFLWYGPLFGKRWAEHMGMADMEQPDGGAMTKSLIIFAVGSLLIAFVFAHAQGVWRASAWGQGPDVSAGYLAWNSALFTWMGFFLPMQMGRVAWEGRKWGLVAINSTFDFVRLGLVALILAFWV